MPDSFSYESKPGRISAETPAGPVPVDVRANSMRVNWQLKAVAPVALVLLAGLMLFVLAKYRSATRSATPCWCLPEREPSPFLHR